MCLLWRSPITWSPEFTSGDFIFNPVIVGSGMLEIGTRQLNNWRLHEPPDLLPFCQPGVLSTRRYCSLMPRHHFRLPGRYRRQVSKVRRVKLKSGRLVPGQGLTDSFGTPPPQVRTASPGVRRLDTSQGSGEGRFLRVWASGSEEVWSSGEPGDLVQKHVR